MSKHQLIVTVLGTDKSGILSEIASTVSEAQCNILDSRQAIYGREFSLTMIIEGTQPAVTKAECILPAVFQRLDLLSMMKRTSHHEKQNLEHLFNVEYLTLNICSRLNIRHYTCIRNRSCMYNIYVQGYIERENDVDIVK